MHQQVQQRSQLEPCDTLTHRHSGALPYQQAATAPLGVVLGVVMPNAHEAQQALADLAHDIALHTHRGAGHALHEHLHVGPGAAQIRNSDVAEQLSHQSRAFSDELSNPRPPLCRFSSNRDCWLFMHRRVIAATMGPREVLLFGLSANPPTGAAGHMGVVSHCRDMFDEIWLLPVYQHIYSSKRQLAPFEHRVEMCRLALETLQRGDGGGATLRVAQEEREMFELAAAACDSPEQLRLGSFDLVQFLRRRYRDASFSLLLGGDTYADLLAGKWKRGDELMQLVKLLVVDRKGVESPWRAREQQRNDRVTYLHVPELSDVSSTKVRATADRAELEQHVDAAVLDYMAEHKLYAFAAEEDKDD
ncbi:unnamed protein product [Phytophthora fragariaefolia]|uniref:Unnamed protein product n=1 Tax=Phytophthora fragariaefolia TaxID=1490495 RepID=A0A9W6X435_9STRA|nr:unnamed protein product [Phytophthora fragariaefolia]